MKTKLILILFFLPILKITSQSITLTFNGMTSGAENIIIENLTNGTSTTLIGENSIILAVNSVNEIKFDDFAMAYPNPFIDDVYLGFVTFNNDIFNIKISNQIGQIIYQQKTKMQIGGHKLKFEAPNSGIYFIKIESKTEQKFFSVICKQSKYNVANLSFEDANNKNITYNKSTNNLTFSFGDVLKYTATNNNNISIITDAPTNTKTYTFEFYECIDYELNIYPIVKVGNQWWMAENLKSTKYSNGSNISGSYVYDNDSANEDVYGRLYTWTAMMNGATGNDNNPSGVHGVCPTAWHVPSESEWDEMRDVLGGKIPMHAKVKEVGTEHWNLPNSDATNESGMTVRPGGLRWGDDGTFQDLGEQAYFWNCSDFDDLDNASGYTFFYETSDYYMYTWNLKTQAQSVRCVKD